MIVEQSIPDWRSSARGRHTVAFTLVELLVVIGIIALLIALLLPSLGLAKQAAQRTACAAKLQQIMLAAQMHAGDHKGFYPLAGYISGDKTFMAADKLNDPYGVHYDYFAYAVLAADGLPDTRQLCPLTFSLAEEMSYAKVMDAATDPLQATAETDNLGFIRHFLCPSQASSVSDLIQVPLLYSGEPAQSVFVWYTEAQSYIYNEGILGYDDAHGRLRGQAGLVRQPTRTMFAADGLGGSIHSVRGAYNTGLPMSTVYNIAVTAPVTLRDALLGDKLAGDPENFDRLRHHGRMNIAFCDGHVETRDVSAQGLSTVFILAP